MPTASDQGERAERRRPGRRRPPPPRRPRRYGPRGRRRRPDSRPGRRSRRCRGLGRRRQQSRLSGWEISSARPAAVPSSAQWRRPAPPEKSSASPSSTQLAGVPQVGERPHQAGHPARLQTPHREEQPLVDRGHPPPDRFSEGHAGRDHATVSLKSAATPAWLDRGEQAPRADPQAVAAPADRAPEEADRPDAGDQQVLDRDPEQGAQRQGLAAQPPGEEGVGRDLDGNTGKTGERQRRPAPALDQRRGEQEGHRVEQRLAEVGRRNPPPHLRTSAGAARRTCRPSAVPGGPAGRGPTAPPGTPRGGTPGRACSPRRGRP